MARSIVIYCMPVYKKNQHCMDCSQPVSKPSQLGERRKPREAFFARPNRRACSQARIGPRFKGLTSWLVVYRRKSRQLTIHLYSLLELRDTVFSAVKCCGLPHLVIIQSACMKGRGVCGRAVSTSNSGSGGPVLKPRPSRCFLRQGTLLHFVSLDPGV